MVSYNFNFPGGDIVVGPPTHEFKIACPVCSRQFAVPDAGSPIPKQPPKGLAGESGISFTPCNGSGLVGTPVDPVVS